MDFIVFFEKNMKVYLVGFQRVTILALKYS